jgi:ATP-dependent helicase/nuclease subunit A
MSAKRLPSDQAVRDRIITELDTTFAVEAGAGTGKTSLLTARIVEAVRTGHARLSEIVAITFTEKAASEFKDRVRDLLDKQLADAGGEEAERLSAALAELDAAHASTIHSFAAEMLRERPVEANVDPGFEVADAVSAGLLFDDIWRRWLARQLDLAGGPLRPAFLAGLTAEQLKGFALFLRDHSGLSPAGEELDLDAALKEFAPAFIGEARALDCEMQARCDSTECSCVSRIMNAVRAADDLDQLAPRDELAPRDQLARLLHVGKLGVSRPQKACKDKEHKTACINGLNRLQGLLDTIRDSAGHQLVCDLTVTLREMVAEYEAAKRERGTLDFDDLLRKARDMLRDNREVRGYFQRRFKMLLVDECQDTDPLQIEICFFLAEAGAKAKAWRDVAIAPGKLLFVGDPKQSIYRFRRADIETYEEAKGVVAKSGEQVTIQQNFRSTPGCVDWFNAVFNQLIRRPDDGLHYQPEYVPLDAWRTEGRPAVTVIAPPEGTVYPKIDEARAAEAEAVAAQIKAMVERGDVIFDKAEECERPMTYGDVALLFRARLAFGAYAAALEVAGVPFRAVSGRSFFKRQEVTELRVVLAAIDRPHDAAAVAAALRTSLLGVSDNELAQTAAPGGFNYVTANAPAGGPYVGAIFGQLRAWREQRNTMSMSALVQTVLSDTKALELFYLKPDGEQRAANLTKLVDAARTYEETPGATFGGFMRWLQEMSTAGEEEESALADEGGNFVKLLTIHKAKGLEFPVVVLGDIAGGRAHAVKSVVDRRDDTFGIELGSKDGGIRTLDFEDAAELEARRSEAESRRLFYVAATRARDRLLLPRFPKKGKPGGYLKYLEDLADDVAADKTETVTAGPAEPVTRGQAFRVDLSGEPPAACATLVADREAWLAARQSALAAASESRTLRTASALAEHGAAGAGEGSRDNALAVGTAVHAVLEHIDLATSDGLAELAEAAAAAGKIPKLRAGIENRVRAALGSELVGRAASAETVYQEVPFTVCIDGTILEGEIDLAFADDAGLHLVDYKTDAVTDETLAAHAANYRLQVGAYALAAGEVFGMPPASATLLFLGEDGARAMPVAIDDALFGDVRARL